MKVNQGDINMKFCLTKENVESIVGAYYWKYCEYSLEDIDRNTLVKLFDGLNVEEREYILLNTDYTILVES